MSRRALLAVAALALAGCPEPGTLYDDGVIITDDGGVLTCSPVVAANGTGHHNPGQSCLAAGCHREGGTGPLFTVGGTLYDRARSGAPVGGGTVVVIDGDGNELELVSATNGNFWTSQPVVFPLLVKASQCPADNPMISLTQTGDCNVAACHGPGDIRVALDGP